MSPWGILVKVGPKDLKMINHLNSFLHSVVTAPPTNMLMPEDQFITSNAAFAPTNGLHSPLDLDTGMEAFNRGL